MNARAAATIQVWPNTLPHLNREHRCGNGRRRRWETKHGLRKTHRLLNYIILLSLARLSGRLPVVVISLRHRDTKDILETILVT
jgi:hypothetical protein